MQVRPDGSVPISQSQTTGLRWAVDGPSDDSLPPCIHGKKIVEPKHKTNRRKFYICADGPHTRLAAARLFHRCTSGKGYYPFPEAEMASKYREESSAELILKLTRPRQGMLPCDGLGPTMCV